MMIRFCDKEVNCVQYETLNRRELRSYFLNGNRNETVCVLDQEGVFKGKITYASLLANPDIYDAVQNECEMLNGQLWAKARIYFEKFQSRYGEVVILPIVDEHYRLICFAYEDDEAKREIRMLRELETCELAGSGLVEFQDIFENYDYVTIDGFNELAYFFAQYLMKRKIPINVRGELWSAFGLKEEWIGLDYREYIIYAEGTQPRSSDLQERKLHSVSAEFECIDLIYEANYKKGYIKDADGSVSKLVQLVKDHENVVLIGDGNEQQSVCNYLLSFGIKTCCFLANNNNRKSQLDIPIMTQQEILLTVKDPVYIECKSRYSAWHDGVNDFDYRGYRRNEQYFLIKDYIDVSQNDLYHIVKDRKVILTGDLHLCKRLSRYYKSKGHYGLYYFDILGEKKRKGNHNLLGIIDKESGVFEMDEILLLVVPRTSADNIQNRDRSTKYEKYVNALKQAGIESYSDYFCNDAIMLIMEEQETKFREEWRPRGILLGRITPQSGNIFFSQLVDGHPNIVSLDWGYLKDNLDNLCIRLAEENADTILPAFLEMYEEEALYERVNMESQWWKDFCESLSRLLAQEDRFTSQELFVLFHLATANAWKLNNVELSQTSLYWEPHMTKRDVNYDQYAQWLSDQKLESIMLTMVRNHSIRAGSAMKGLKDTCFNQNSLNASRGLSAFNAAIMYTNDSGRYIDGWKYHTLRFEDLKCRPKEELTCLCEKMGIPWSDTLMETTERGNNASYGKVTGFDLGPVYCLYEEYFSGFDRMRLLLLSAPWQKAYGYPYEDCTVFSRKELQDLFLKKFKFEDLMHFIDKDEESECRIDAQKLIHSYLWKARRDRLMEVKGINE